MRDNEKQKILETVTNSIDAHTDDLSKEDYIEILEALIENLLIVVESKE